MLLVPINEKDYIEFKESSKQNKIINRNRCRELLADFLESNDEICEVVDVKHTYSDIDSVRIVLSRLIKQYNASCVVERVRGRVFLRKTGRYRF